MEKLPSGNPERIPPKRDSLPLVELFLQINREHLKDLQRKLESLGIPIGGISRVLRLPVDLLNDGEE